MRLPFYYGWVIVAAGFVTMAVGVNARTAFSLLFPPIVEELGWPRAATAGAFSFGFLISAVLGPFLGKLMDRWGPRTVIGLGVGTMGSGMLLASLSSQPWHLYATLGVLVGSGSVCLGYTGQGLFVPNWFARRRGLATAITYSGVGVGSILLLPAVQAIIERAGWRSACIAIGVLILVVLTPLCFLLRKTPQEIGLRPDGDAAPAAGAPARPALRVVDEAWAAVDWTLAGAARTARFWWIAAGFFTGMFAWYAVQVHQTKYLTEIGFSGQYAAWALGFVSLAGIPGQIALGHLSDRIGREWVWTIGQLGFAVSYTALLLLREFPSAGLLWIMVVSQGLLGYGVTSVISALVAEIFQGKHYGVIFGTLMGIGVAGGAVGPWVTGLAYDLAGSYAPGFFIALACTFVSAVSIWFAAPRTVRAVAAR